MPRAKEPVPIPAEVTIHRTVPAGRHPLLAVFEGLDRSPAFARYPGAAERVRAVLAAASATVVEGPGYMYVAPRETPIEVRRAGFEMHTSPEDEIVVSRRYLTKGPAIDLYLDVLHEFLHLLQRHDGRELWPPKFAYVDRSTEREAYAFSVVEGRRLGLDDRYFAKYLEVPWVARSDYLRLLGHLGVAPPTPRRKLRRVSRAAAPRRAPRAAGRGSGRGRTPPGRGRSSRRAPRGRSASSRRARA